MPVCVIASGSIGQTDCRNMLCVLLPVRWTRGYVPFGAAASTRSAEIVAPLRALAAALASTELAEALAIG